MRAIASENFDGAEKTSQSKGKLLGPAPDRIGVCCGRFQPFHNGHLFVVEDIVRNYPDVVLYLVVAAIEAPLTRVNPFTAAERVEMINTCMDSLDLAVRAVSFLVASAADSRPAHARLGEVVPGYEIVFSGEEDSYRLFSNRGYQVVRMSRSREPVSGSTIRRLMLERGNWQQLVPEPVADYIERKHLDRRLADLAQGEKHPWKRFPMK